MMTPVAINNDVNSGYTLVPLKEIYADPEFNCRGTFTADKIIELAKDVAERGLIQPVTIRPLWENEEEQKKRGFKYSLVAGFRRYSAYKANEAEVIPSNVREVKTDFECRDLNAVENLQRESLTFWQEAKSIRHYWLADWKREEIAKRVNKSPGWVYMRIQLLECEPEIQNAAEQGYLVPTDIREIVKYRGIERLQVAGRIRDARKRGETRNVAIRSSVKKDKPNESKIRKPLEVLDLMEVIRTTLQQADRDQMILLSDIVSSQGNSIVTRVLAWSCGNATNLDLHMELRDFFKAIGITYQLPDFEMTNL